MRQQFFLFSGSAVLVDEKREKKIKMVRMKLDVFTTEKFDPFLGM